MHDTDQYRVSFKHVCLHQAMTIPMTVYVPLVMQNTAK